MAGVHVGDTNTRFLLTIKDEDGVIVPLGSATVLELSFYKPDHTTISRVLTLYTNGDDGKVFYDSVAGDFDIPGLWRYQARFVFPTGEKHSSILSFRVLENLT